MKKVFVATGLVLLAAILLSGQYYKGKGRLLGIVLDEQGNPIDDVTVKLFSVKANDGFETKSGKDGRWKAVWIRGGTWNIDFEKVGYAPKKISIEVNEYQKNPEVPINLVKIEGLVVTDEMKVLLTEGNRLFDEQNYEGAAAKYREILDKYPDAYPINISLGNCHFAQEQYDLAESYYLKVLEEKPDQIDAIIAIGNCYSNRGDTDKALEWYGKVEFDKIEDPIVLYNLGTNYYNNARFEDALKFYVKAVEKQQGFADALYQLGLTYLNLQKNAEAIAAFEDYLKLDSESERAGQVRGFLDFLKKK